MNSISIGVSGGISALVEALRDESVELIEAAADVLATLTHNNQRSTMWVDNRQAVSMYIHTIIPFVNPTQEVTQNEADN